MVLPNPLNFTVRATTVYGSLKQPVFSGCYGWMVINFSLGEVAVNEIPLPGAVAPGLVGGSFGFMDNRGGYYMGDITITMDATTPAPRVVIIQIMDMSR